MPIEKKQDLLLKSLLQFYKKEANISQLIRILDNKADGVSLRIIDYLCTNYAKKCDVIYYVDKTLPFNLYLQYRSQLKAYSKMQFDPFRRHQRIHISVPESVVKGGKLETTVAQLNFFKWAIENKVIEYISNQDVLQKVEKHMNAACKKQKSNVIPESPSITKKVVSASAKRHNINVTVTFR